MKKNNYTEKEFFKNSKETPPQNKISLDYTAVYAAASALTYQFLMYKESILKIYSSIGRQEGVPSVDQKS